MDSVPMPDLPIMPTPPSLVGQIVVQSAQLNVAELQETKQRAIIIAPSGSALQIVVPVDESSAKIIGAALLAKHVVLPGQNGRG